jgi:hypothetical protein
MRVASVGADDAPDRPPQPAVGGDQPAVDTAGQGHVEGVLGGDPAEETMGRRQQGRVRSHAPPMAVGLRVNGVEEIGESVPAQGMDRDEPGWRQGRGEPLQVADRGMT